MVISGDVVQMRRFATGLDVPSPGTNEAQRADAAPRAQLGDGVINSGDVTQARRYAAGLDPLTGAGGPDFLAEPSSWKLFEAADHIIDYFFGREIRIGQAHYDNTSRLRLPIAAALQGDETAMSFTLEFDQAVLRRPVLTLGKIVPEGTVLTINNIEDGRIGVLIDSPVAFTASAVSEELVWIEFEVVQDQSIGGSAVRFTDSVAGTGVSDEYGNTIRARFVDGQVTFRKYQD